MANWLLKSEPDSYGWDDLHRDGGTEWDGVRNPAAAKHLREMAVGDRALIYHSGKAKAVVGVARITRAAQPDGSEDGEDGRWVSVRVEPVAPLPRPVTLAAIKAQAALADMPLVRQGRLSVSPVSDEQWVTIIAMADDPARG